MIDQVLKQFPSFDDAFSHLQEFLDLNLGDDDEQMGEDSDDHEELKGAAAASQDKDNFNASNVFKGSS